MNVYRLSNWTHRQPGAVVGFDAQPKGTHAVMVCIGNIPKEEELTEEKLLDMLAAAGLEVVAGGVEREKL